MKVKVKIEKMIGFTDKQTELYMKAANAVAYELNNDQFWNEVKNRWNSFTWKNGYTFIEYKDLVMSGNNDFDTDSDNEINISVTRYYSFKNVIGYTKPSTVMTWINRKFLNMNIADFAGHIWHEQQHNKGFNHPNTDRNSLVYQVGYIMRDCVKNRVFIGEKPQEPVRLRWYQRLWKWIF